jgi:hypothetical protein
MGYRRHIVITSRGATSRPAAAPPPPSGQVVYLNSSVGSAVTSLVLEAGVAYLLTVQGTWSDWNAPLAKGTPEPDAMFPGPVSLARKSTQVGIDAETLFAQPSNFSHQLGEWKQFQLLLGGKWVHPEPAGGPYTSPQPGHLYRYTVTGEGKQLSLRIADTPLNDNYGQLKATITIGGNQ